MNENLPDKSHEKHLSKTDERYVNLLQWSIHSAVRVLAFLMAIVIWFGVADVIYVLYTRITSHPIFLIEISDILATFGAFMAVLIAIEIFINIISYLRDDAIQIEIVIATAYMAILRKVIVLDYKETDSKYVFATAAVVIAISLGYWLTISRNKTSHLDCNEQK